MEQVAVMQNMFCNKKITKIFDLKGSLRGRFAAQIQRSKDEASSDQLSDKPKPARRQGSADKWPDDTSSARDGDTNSLLDGSDDQDSSMAPPATTSGPATLLDGDFLEFTSGRPMPLTDRAKALFQMSILNVSGLLSLSSFLFLKLANSIVSDRTSAHGLPIAFFLHCPNRTLCSYRLSTFLIIPFWWELTTKVRSWSSALLTSCASMIS